MTTNALPSDVVGVGFSHQTLLTASVVGFLGVAAVVYALILSRVKSSIDDDDDDAEYEAKLARADVAHLNRAQRRARAHFLMKQQRKVSGNNTVPNDNDNNMDDNNPEPPPLEIVASRKERQKAAKAAEREERQRFQEQRQQQQEQAQQEATLERVRRQELAAIRAAETQRMRHAEMLLQQQTEENAKQIFLSSPAMTWTVDEWTTSLTTRRVDLEALGAQFGTSSHAVHQRIQQLLVEGRVTGILETKQFIVLSEEELQSIADQIREKGAVTLPEVAELCRPLLAS